MGCSTCTASRRLREPEKYTQAELEEAKQVLATADEHGPFGGKSLVDLYREAVNTPGDINEHSPKLKELASGCDHVTDMGTRTAFSTVALLAGQPKRMVHVARDYDSYSLIFERRREFTENTEFVVQRGIPPAWDMTEDTDLLFIDTQHNANQIYLELAKYAGRVRRYIVRHDTTIYGEVGDGGGPGLRVGILQFLKENPEWSVIYDTPLQYGLMVLARRDEDKPSLPSLGRQVFNYSKHLARTVVSGTELVPDDVFVSRLDKCLPCIHRVNDRCSLCGCFLDHNTKTNKPGKAAYATEECPMPEPEKRWGIWTPPVSSPANG